MSDLKQAGTFPLDDRTVNRMGYGAMQLAGPGVFGPPKDHAAAVVVLRAALEAGVNHIDTSDFYGPHVTNKIIREALHPYADDLVIVTKVGALRGDDASWNPAQSPAQLEQAVHDNLRNLGLDVLDAVNLRIMGNVHAPSEGSIEPQFSALARLQQKGLIRHLGLSNVTATQVAEAQRIAPWSACRTSSIWRIAKTMPLSMHSPRKASPTWRSFRLVASRRCNRRHSPRWLRVSGLRRCRSHWRGCSRARPISC